jgi:multiple sugar transport system substrate-binding protein
MSDSKQTKRGLTRRQVMKTGAAAAAVTSAIGIGPRFLRPTGAWAADLAPGMTGGPTGFAGAERYQYNESMSEGRAVEAVRKLKAAGKAPDKLNVLMTDGAIGHFTKPWPPNGPTLKDIWERETGVELVFFGVSPEQQFTKVIQDITTSSGAYDVYTFGYAAMGDLSEANGLVPLDDWVEQHGADFNDRERGAVTEEAYNMLYKYGGRVMSVNYDGDYQCWVYRKDLTENPEYKKEFADKYGWEPGPPRTWQETDQMSEFFTSKGFLGNGNMMSAFWGLSTWYNRYVSKANPNQHLFDDEGNPLITGDLGIEATAEHIKSLDWADRGGLAYSWSEYYGAMQDGRSFQIGTFSNLPKFLDRFNEDGTPATKVTGKLNSFLPPGHQHGNDLVRRSINYLGNNGGVSSQSKYQEVAWLFLQWSGSTRIFSLLTGNPGGFFDPHQAANFSDPLVIQSYHDYHVPVIAGTAARSVPTIAIPGQFAMHNALDENLQAALVGDMSAKEAMENTAKSWRKHLKKKGQDKMVELINQAKAGWSTVID